MGSLGNGRKEKAVMLAFVALLFSTFVSIRLAAQTPGKTLSGTVKAPDGSTVPDVQVSMKNTSVGRIEPVIVNEDGSYMVRDVEPGTYEITASAPGSAGAAISVTIGPDASYTANLVLMSLGSGQDHLTQGAESACCDKMSSKTMGELPLNGRSASDVAALEPGVIKARTQNVSNGANGYGIQMEIFGGRPRQNNSRLDNISVNDYANGPLGNAIGITLGVDALEQLSVLTRNDQAQYGRSSGGIISSSTRSGTNSFHGSVFEYIRNSALDTMNYFDLEKPPFRRNQFGGSVGGPVWKNRTFVFGNYEGIRQSQGVTNRSTVPSDAARAGNLSTGAVTVDPQILRFLNAFYPRPNAGLLGKGDTGIYISSGQKITPGNHAVARIDHRLADKDLLAGIYMFDGGSVTQPDKLDNKLTGYDSRQQFFTVSETRTFSPKSVNSFRFGINRVVANTGMTSLEHNPSVGDTSYGAIPGRTAPIIDVLGLVNFEGGLDSTFASHLHWTSIQAYDDVSITRGNHALKFGAGLERMRNNAVASSNQTGHFSFSKLSDFLTNRPYSLSVEILGAPSGFRFRQSVVGAYIQDEWRWRPNFLLNLGLRYETLTEPTEVQNKLTSLRNLTDAQPHLGAPLFSNPTRRNFEPRVGFAWDPLRDGKTIVSSGFGIFDVLPLLYQIEYSGLLSDPFYHSADVAQLPAGSFPTGAFTIAAASPNAVRQAYFEPNPHRNYVMQWNFTVQRILPSGLNMKLGYVGSHGVHHIFRVQDADIVLPTLTPRGYLWPSPAGSGARLNPYAGRIDATWWEGDSSYNALVFQVRKQIARGSQIVGSYTWGKSLDTSSTSLGGSDYSNALSSPLWFDTRLNRGQSDFDIAQDLKVIYSWEIAGPKSSSVLLTRVLGGWQLGGVLEATTGVPFTPRMGGDPLGLNSLDPTSDVPNVISGPGCESLVNPGDPTHYIRTQCFAVPNPITLRGNIGRNSLIGPGLLNLDCSLFKNNYVESISDTFNVQFRAEFFNIMNHPNLNAPLSNRNVFDSQGNPVGNAGLIDSTQTSSRQIQFALKFIW